jgi:uncharacterized protein (TIGR02271 family)
MKVRSSDGDKLGEIIDVADGSIVVEKGFFFPKDHVIPASAIREIKDDEVWLDITKDELGRFDEGQATATDATTSTTGAGMIGSNTGAAGLGTGAGLGAGLGAGVGMGEYGGIDDRRRGDARTTGEGDRGSTGAGMSGASGGDVRKLTLAEEEVEATKRVKEAGEVRVRKDVVTETKHVEVPVAREEVHVERVPVQAGSTASPGAFEDESISMPVREEELEIRKKPVVKEEIRLRRTATQQERRADVEVRREEARIEGEDDEKTRGDLDVDPARGDPKY